MFSAIHPGLTTRCLMLAVLSVGVPQRHAFAHDVGLTSGERIGISVVEDSIPVLTMGTVRRLAAARSVVDSIAKIVPLPSSRLANWELPLSLAGKITLATADVDSKPVFTAAVRRHGFQGAAAYATALVGLDAAWSVVVAQHASRPSNASNGANATASRPAPSDSAFRGVPSALVGFVREHESEIAALGFTPPAAFVPADENGHEYFTPTTRRRTFFDADTRSIRVVTSPESDYLQGFIDSAGPVPRGSARPLRVLFLGNSLTYYHAMPRLFAHMAAAGLHRRVVAGLVSIPGASLPSLWKGSDAREVLERLPWDVVVVQVRPDGWGDTEANSIARTIGEIVKAHGGRMFAWYQYATPGSNPAFRSAIDHLVDDAARGAHASVAPVADAWDAVRGADTTLWRRLFSDIPGGDMHPSPLGSYLLALSFYRGITERSPVGLPYTIGDFSVSKRDAERLQRLVATTRLRKR